MSTAATPATGGSSSSPWLLIAGVFHLLIALALLALAGLAGWSAYRVHGPVTVPQGEMTVLLRSLTNWLAGAGIVWLVAAVGLLKRYRWAWWLLLVLSLIVFAPVAVLTFTSHVRGFEIVFLFCAALPLAVLIPPPVLRATSWHSNQLEALKLRS